MYLTIKDYFIKQDPEEQSAVHTHTHTQWNITHYNVFWDNRITGNLDFIPDTFLCFPNFLQ